MALTSTLYTGLSGIDVNQTRLQVIGNNIANANTIAYKSSRALFSSQFYITDSAGSPPTSSFGGTNPSQRGLGAVVASIQKNNSGGNIEGTGQDTDMAIDGDGYFIIQSDKERYTRDGSFIRNENNELVTTSGDFVQGYGVNPASGTIVQGKLVNVVIPIGTDTMAKATQNISFKGNLNTAGALATQGTVLASQTVADVNVDSGGDHLAIDASTKLVDLRNVDSTGTVTTTAAFTDGQVLTLTAKEGGRSVDTATLTIDSNTTMGQLEAFFNNALGFPSPTSTSPGATIINDTSAGMPNNAAKLQITGYPGDENALDIKQADFADSTGVSPMLFTQTAAASGESVYTTLEVYDSVGTPLMLDMTTSLTGKTDTTTTYTYHAVSPDNADASNPGGRFIASGTLTFDNQGKLISSTGSPITIHRDGLGTRPVTMYLDFSQMTSLTAEEGGQSQMVAESQDGYKLGTLSTFSIGADGMINGAYTNGMTRVIGQIAIATFNNPNGLTDVGNNRLERNAVSGEPARTAPQLLGAGAIKASSLEQSNVDISSEFINMIIASSGFSASSKVISTSDQLLTELLQTVR